MVGAGSEGMEEKEDSQKKDSRTKPPSVVCASTWHFAPLVKPPFQLGLYTVSSSAFNARQTLHLYSHAAVAFPCRLSLAFRITYTRQHMCGSHRVVLRVLGQERKEVASFPLPVSPWSRTRQTTRVLVSRYENRAGNCVNAHTSAISDRPTWTDSEAPR